MIKRYDIHPRRRRTNGEAPPSDNQDSQRISGPPMAGPLTPAGAFDDK
jgi:hypothetical protein